MCNECRLRDIIKIFVIEIGFACGVNLTDVVRKETVSYCEQVSWSCTKRRNFLGCMTNHEYA
jgi:hypothetical protein